MMKNNTKLIMETWRRFLKEGTEGIDEDGMVIEMHDEDDPSSLPAVADTDLEGDMDDIGEFNPYDSSPIPPEGLDDEDDIGAYLTDDKLYETDGDSLDPDIAFDSGSFDDDENESFTDYDEEMQRLEMQRLRRK